MVDRIHDVERVHKGSITIVVGCVAVSNIRLKIWGAVSIWVEYTTEVGHNVVAPG